jgi:hypothetical protein
MKSTSSIVAALMLAVGCGSVSESDPDAAAGAPDAATQAIDAPDQSQPDAPVDAALAWSAFEPVGVDFSGAIYTPTVSADGLTLYFTSLNQIFDIYYAERASTDADFGAASILPIANAADEQKRYPELSHDGLELYFSNGDTGPIMVSSRATTSSPWGTPVPTGVSGNFPSISGDKLSLYYIEQLDGADGQFRRITRATVGQPWSNPTTVDLPGAIDIYSSIEISADELSVLRAAVATGNSNDILIGHRASRGDEFSGFEVLATVDPWNSAFRSLRWNADENELWLSRDDGGSLVPHVSRLQ